MKEKKQNFKISASPVIKYGKYKLPIKPVTQGMGAAVDFNKDTAVLTVTKGTTVIVINFEDKTVMVNGAADTNSGIFTAKNDKKMTVLIKYIANKLGVRVNVKGDDVATEIPGLDLPTDIKIMPVGLNVAANTLNSTTLYMTAAADIIAGQAVGGKAELYVGSKLVAVDNTIEAADTTVTFTTSDGTPTNEELKALIPEGGKVSVKLYNADQQAVTSEVKNPTLKVDYIIPTLTGITSANYVVSGSSIVVNVTGAGEVNDKVDVTKISLYDSALNKTYQLSNVWGTGSVGVVSSDSRLTITLGSADREGLAGFGSSELYLNVAAGPILIDKSGNKLAEFSGIQNIPVTLTK
ncbi:hypothetical protein Ana3638_22360 [Anaerocolumna sedimenticola]|uniref:Copper amine oxidase-like N-terminal domain-containing protein n=1 Tax=Anaerocolumna sedimenticola TaxID=2696063 RepID=A0A6P1TUL4_9FIRM|nr:stalk domain-containing protein [Anaerocolumna sedimenticola]QHQ63178.1 hypothetical protein Ana3638_22360 [Anaerocolumna sedimenticola]